MPEISIVTTLYRSAGFLPQFVKECLEALNRAKIHSFELVFVNDGSPDNSVDILLDLQKECHQIVIVDLSKNFGHHHAIQAGLSYAQGDCLFLIDCDLEVSPLVLVDFYALLKKKEVDVVYGYQESRKGGFVEKWFGMLFWKGINFFSETKIPENILTERLMTKQYVDSLLSLGDANLFLGGMMYWVGYNQIGLSIKKKQRKGQSTYSIKKRLSLMINAITSFTSQPLQWVFYIGLFISLSSFLAGSFLIVQKVIYGSQVSAGWTSLIVINIFILGIQTTFLGLIGTYISKIFNQVKNRPNFIIDKIYKKEHE